MNYYDDIEQWTSIAQSNNLQYPYIVDTVKEKLENPSHLVTYGDLLIIPIESTIDDYSVQKSNTQETDLVSKLALGQDISVIDFPQYYNKYGGQDEVVQMDGQNGDLKLVTGIDNIKQVLIMRLLTPKGSLVLHPTYGSSLTQMFKASGNYTIQMINDEISKNILSDSRVSGCHLDSYTLEGDTYSSSWSVSLESIDAQFSFVMEHDSSGDFNIY